MVPGGRIEGVVKDPTGKIIAREEGDYSDNMYVNIDIRGVGIPAGGHADVNNEGKFKSNTLPPGNYNIYARVYKRDFNDDREDRIYPIIFKENISVRSGELTFVELKAKEPANVVFQVPQPPVPPEGYDSGNYAYAVLGLPVGEKINGLYLQRLTARDKEPVIPMVHYDIGTQQWLKPMIAAGKYSFYEVYAQLFGWSFEQTEGPAPNPYEFITVLSSAKNKDLLTSNTTNYVEFGPGKMGKATLKGDVSGSNIFRQEDLDKTRGNHMAFMDYIPTLMLYDSNGEFIAYAGIRPKVTTPVAAMAWDAAIASGSIDQLINAMKLYPVAYTIKSLPIGDYTLVGESHNYPPLIKKVTLTSGINTLDLDLDDAGAGATIYGVISDTNSIKLNGVSITLIHDSFGERIIMTDDADNTGRYNAVGLPGGIYRILVRKSGYALAGAKIGIGDEAREKLDFVLRAAKGKIMGKVYSQKIPVAKYLKNATVIAYNETYNAQNPSSYVPAYKTITDNYGSYKFEDMIIGETYKVFAYSKGRRLGVDEVAASTGTVVDFVLPEAPPKLKLTMKRTADPREFTFLLESPKTLISPPECYYNPGDAFDPDQATRALAISGANNTYTINVRISGDHEYYYFKAAATADRINIESAELVFSPLSDRNSKADIDAELAQGGSVNIDELGEDFSGLYIDPGALEPTGAPASGKSVSAIGGFYTALPVFGLAKTGEDGSATLAGKLAEIAVSDVYDINMEAAQMKKKLTVSLEYDIDQVGEDEIDELRVYKYNEETLQWERVPGVRSINPAKGTISCEIGSISEPVLWSSASGEGAPLSAGRTSVQKDRNVINPLAATSQSGKFAVFKADPNSAKAYSGDKFIIYNFPNPFDLNEKTVSKENVTVDESLTTQGTVIMYALP
ncbi:hypothetical protein ACFLTD_05470, partial [Elusimicrobiota bacterium]